MIRVPKSSLIGVLYYGFSRILPVVCQGVAAMQRPHRLLVGSLQVLFNMPMGCGSPMLQCWPATHTRLTSWGSSAHSQIRASQHLHPDASHLSAGEPSISKTAPDLNPWEQLSDKPTTSQGWEVDEEQRKKLQDSAALVLTGRNRMKEQNGMSWVEDRCLPTSPTHIPQKCLRFWWRYGSGRGNNETWKVKRRTRAFRQKWALVKAVTAT